MGPTCNLFWNAGARKACITCFFCGDSSWISCDTHSNLRTIVLLPLKIKFPKRPHHLPLVTHSASVPHPPVLKPNRSSNFIQNKGWNSRQASEAKEPQKFSLLLFFNWRDAIHNCSLLLVAVRIGSSALTLPILFVETWWGSWVDFVEFLWTSIFRCWRGPRESGVNGRGAGWLAGWREQGGRLVGEEKEDRVPECAVRYLVPHVGSLFLIDGIKEYKRSRNSAWIKTNFYIKNKESKGRK